MTKTVDYGIDLGTTNSCIARWEGGSVRVFQNNDQMNVTPSAVHILKTGRVIVGRRAYAALLTDTDNVSIEFKRWMDRRIASDSPLPSENSRRGAIRRSPKVSERGRTQADGRRCDHCGHHRSGCVWCTPMRGYCPCGRTCRTAGSTTASGTHSCCHRLRRASRER